MKINLVSGQVYFSIASSELCNLFSLIWKRKGAGRKREKMGVEKREGEEGRGEERCRGGGR